MPAGEQRGSGSGRNPERQKIRVLVVDERGHRVPAPALTRWLASIAPRRAQGTVSLALVSDRTIRTLNRRYRRVDRATDVLSFPSSAVRGILSASSASSVVESSLGEIVIAPGVARRQARAAGHSELTELRVLALHGLLHLLGYDHDRDDGRMLKVERRLRRKGGLREGLIERAR